MRLRQASDMPLKIFVGTNETHQIGAVSHLRAGNGLLHGARQQILVNAEAIVAGFDRPCEEARIIEAQKLREKPVIIGGVSDAAARSIGAREELDDLRARFAPGDVGKPGPVRSNDDLSLSEECHLPGNWQVAQHSALKA